MMQCGGYVTNVKFHGSVKETNLLGGVFWTQFDGGVEFVKVLVEFL